MDQVLISIQGCLMRNLKSVKSLVAPWMDRLAREKPTLVRVEAEIATVMMQRRFLGHTRIRIADRAECDYVKAKLSLTNAADLGAPMTGTSFGLRKVPFVKCRMDGEIWVTRIGIIIR